MMKYKNTLCGIVFYVLTTFSLVANADVSEPYKTGIHEWKTPNGTLYLISGLMTDVEVYENYNYTFYFRPLNKEIWYQVDFVNKIDDIAKNMMLSTKNEPEQLIRDAAVVSFGEQTYVFIADKDNAKGGYKDGAVTVQTYELTENNLSGWPYRFLFKRQNVYPANRKNSLETAMKKEIELVKVVKDKQ